MTIQNDASRTSTGDGATPTIEWLIENVVNPWDINKLLRLKSLIETKLFERLLAKKARHPRRFDAGIPVADDAGNLKREGE